MYSNYYLRFSSREYTPGALDDTEIHLTNQSVQKHSEEYGAAVECNMWSRRQFVEHLSHLCGGAAAGRAAAENIEGQMARAVGVALRATCDIIEHRRCGGYRSIRQTSGLLLPAPCHTVPLVCSTTPDVVRSDRPSLSLRSNSFELFGFDFLVDARRARRSSNAGQGQVRLAFYSQVRRSSPCLDSHRVWLLEANSSPDMSTHAAPLKQIVHDGLDDLLTIVLELKRNRTPTRQLGAARAAQRAADADGERPCWRLVHRGAVMSERELQRRRIAKKAGADAPAGGAAVFQGLSHQSALRQWIERIGTFSSGRRDSATRGADSATRGADG